MATEKRQRTVTAKVLGHSEWNGKPKTDLDIEEWSQYPIPLYNIKPEHQKLLPRGATLRVVLEAGRLKEDKDPEKPYNYFWGFVRIADGGEGMPFDEPEPDYDDGLFGDEPRPNPPRPMDRDTSIRRQVALKIAAEVTKEHYPYGAAMSMRDGWTEETTELASLLNDWLGGGA